MKNLFPAGKPVEGDMLIGRNSLLNELKTIIDIGQSVILIAPRRYGKTSVAEALLERSKKEGLFVGEIDLFEVSDEKELAEKMVETCFKNNPVPIEKYWQKLKKGALNVLSMLKFKPSDEDVEMVLQFGQPSVDRQKLLDDALDFPEKFCVRHKKHMVMFMDEFQEILKIGGEALSKKMRAKIQRHKRVTYIFAGSQETLMTELFQQKRHAFYRFGRLFNVDVIAKDDFVPYILKSFEGEDITIDWESLEAIFDSARGHPYYTQLLCQMIYIDCLKERRKSVRMADVKNAETAVVEHEAALFDEIWKELGNKKYSRKIVGLIANGLSPYSSEDTSKENIARILADLLRYGYLSKIGSAKNIKYELKDPFFKKYILSK